MSRENVELMHAWREAWNAGDMDAVREFYDPDVVVRPNKDWPERGPFFGREAVTQWFEQLRDTWDKLVIETISQIDAGDRIVARVISRGTGRGPAYGAEFTTVTTVRKGKILYLEFFWDHAEALEAVGLEQAMPQQNVELVRSIYELWERGDFRSVEWAHPEIEFVRVDTPGAGRWTGIAGMAEGWREWLGSWEKFRVVAEEYRELDDERVLVPTHSAGRGKTSGVDIGETLSLKGATLFQVCDGRVTRLVVWADRRRAYADLGLGSDASVTS